MRTLELSDEAYAAAEARARAEGFEGPAAWFESLVSEEPEVVFTPEMLRIIEAASADARAGNVFTLEEVDARWREKREIFLRERGR